MNNNKPSEIFDFLLFAFLMSILVIDILSWEDSSIIKQILFFIIRIIVSVLVEIFVFIHPDF